MGNSQSVPSLNEDELEDYASLTYLSKGEILYLMKKFHAISPDKMNNDPQYRFNRQEVISKFDVLKTNPLQDRIFSVFSSKNDDCFSFEDMLDLCSAMSPECPPEVKAEWAFRIYVPILSGQRIISHTHKNDDCLSFEDMLDLCSAMSPECPPEVKAEWAFHLDDDNQITSKDLSVILDRLTSSSLDKESKDKIIKVILNEMKLDNSGNIGLSEFKIILSRMPEFPSSFYFKM